MSYKENIKNGRVRRKTLRIREEKNIRNKDKARRNTSRIREGNNQENK